MPKYTRPPTSPSSPSCPGRQSLSQSSSPLRSSHPTYLLRPDCARSTPEIPLRIRRCRDNLAPALLRPSKEIPAQGRRTHLATKLVARFPSAPRESPQITDIFATRRNPLACAGLLQSSLRPGSSTTPL